jgi:Ca2+-binding RTX toxin-like protein
MSVRRAPLLTGVAVAGLLLLGASFAPDAEARMRCSYSGPPQNLLTVTADRDAFAEIIRSGEEIVVRDFRRPPSRCRGGVPTVLNTDTIRAGANVAGVVRLEGGPFAPGTTPEAEGAPEIEIEFRGGTFSGITGTPQADDFHWGPGGASVGLNLNPGSAGDEDVDVTGGPGGRFPALVHHGGAGNDRIIPGPNAVAVKGPINAYGGRGDDLLIAPQNTSGSLIGGRGNDIISGGRVGFFIGGRGNDVITGGRLGDIILSGGAGADRIAGERGSDRIEGGRGRDLLLGGRGRDVILARDSRRDRASCGSGRDRVKADRRDRLRGCEVIRRR